MENYVPRRKEISNNIKEEVDKKIRSCGQQKYEEEATEMRFLKRRKKLNI